MIKLEVVAGVVALALWIFFLIDVLGTREDRVRHLPKLGWFALVLLFPLVGSVAWVLAGRPKRQPARPRPTDRRSAGKPQRGRPGRAAALSSEDNEEFLRRCRERAEGQRRRHRESQGGVPQGEPDPPAE